MIVVSKDAKKIFTSNVNSDTISLIEESSRMGGPGGRGGFGGPGGPPRGGPDGFGGPGGPPRWWDPTTAGDLPEDVEGRVGLAGRVDLRQGGRMTAKGLPGEEVVAVDLDLAGLLPADQVAAGDGARRMWRWERVPKVLMYRQAAKRFGQPTRMTGRFRSLTGRRKRWWRP